MDTKMEKKPVNDEAVKVMNEKHGAAIRDWKLKHGVVRCNFTDDLRFVFFKLPKRQELSAAEALSVDENGQVDVYKKAERLMVDNYLGGDITLEEILDDTRLFMPVAKFVLYELVIEKKITSIDC